MTSQRCPVCGGNMKRHGKTAANSQRWQCMSCKATKTRKIDSSAKKLDTFLRWLLSAKTQVEMPGQGRSFRRAAERFWEIWPIAPVCDEIFHVVFVDGIWLGRNVVVLIACTKDHVIGWHVARSENSGAWAALMARIASPDVVVTDGGSGFEKVRRTVWPQTRVQRCTFHAFCQVKRQTTTRPKLQAGVELYGIAKSLLHVVDADGAAAWTAEFAMWCSRWDSYLKEKTLIEGRMQYKHERLRRARRGLEKLVRANVLFTYIDESLLEQGGVPATTNLIEGGVNAQLRAMLRCHRGMKIDRRIKAISWWCLMHTENPPSAADILQEMPTDNSIAHLYRLLEGSKDTETAIAQWGTAVVWHELHSSGGYRMDYD